MPSNVTMRVLCCKRESTSDDVAAAALGTGRSRRAPWWQRIHLPAGPTMTGLRNPTPSSSQSACSRRRRAVPQSASAAEQSRTASTVA